MNDLISRKAVIDAIERLDIPEDMCVFEILSHIELKIGTLPTAEPIITIHVDHLTTEDIERIKREIYHSTLIFIPYEERKKMTNRELIGFLSEQFEVSRTSAKEMLHKLMMCKADDNFKKQISGGRK